MEENSTQRGLSPPLPRYWHTLRHLRPVQFYGRVWQRLNPARPDNAPAPDCRRVTGLWQRAALRPACMTGPGRFHFLNRDGQVQAAADWNDPAQEKLWLYNLHYFDDLNAPDADSRTDWHRVLIERWVEENAPGHGNGWEPYPVSLRIVNWVKWALAGNALEPSWHQSLAVQVRWLASHLEYHLLGNHLFANAKALVFAGLWFEGAEADRWLAKGLEILTRELPEQILADGGHFERSPMYHAILLEDLLDLLNAEQAWPGRVPGTAVEAWRRLAAGMLDWLHGLSHPDGDIAFFNDASFAIAARPGQLLAYAQALGLPGTDSMVDDGLRAFDDSGYVRLQRGPAVALLDVAPIGPDYLPGHAHADTLSFELSLFGQRVFVNSGTSRYGAGAERLRQRGTAAHNTVTIDGADSSEVWGGFRVARRARPFDLAAARNDGVLEVACAHDGYRRLPGRPVHRRHWCLGAHGLAVEDSLDGHWREAVARYYLGPQVEVTADGCAGKLRLPGGESARWRATGADVRVVPSTWHPEFGLSVENRCIELWFTVAEVRLELEWG